MSSTKLRAAAIGSALILSLGGGAYATAASKTGSSTKITNPDETALTGDTAARVRAAALDRLPGATILRVETDEGGVYEAHVRKTDGTDAEVKVDKSFTVTAVETGGRGGRGGHGGPGGRGGHLDTASLATTLGVTEAKLTAALQAVRPARGDKGSRGADRAAAIATSLGVTEAKVRAILEAGHGRRGPRGGGDRTALITALAKAFNVSEARAKEAVAAAEAAHQKSHDARDTALATALAKELGLDAAEVKAALDAARPERPGKP